MRCASRRLESRYGSSKVLGVWTSERAWSVPLLRIHTWPAPISEFTDTYLHLCFSSLTFHKEKWRGGRADLIESSFLYTHAMLRLTAIEPVELLGLSQSISGASIVPSTHFVHYFT